MDLSESKWKVLDLSALLGQASELQTHRNHSIPVDFQVCKTFGFLATEALQ